MALYNCIYDARQTQFGFSLRYFPVGSLSLNLRSHLRSNRIEFMDKAQMEVLCNEEKTSMLYDGHEWEIVWRNAATPTEAEYLKWNRYQRFQLEFRHTNLHGRVVILHTLRISNFADRAVAGTANSLVY